MTDWTDRHHVAWTTCFSWGRPASYDARSFTFLDAMLKYMQPFEQRTTCTRCFSSMRVPGVQP